MTIEHEERVDTAGGHRTVTTTTEEPLHTTTRADAEYGEEAITHSDPGSFFRGIFRTLSLFVLVGLAIIEAGLGFRLAFLLAGANPANGFVDFIYDSTNELVEPFGGIVTNEAVDGGGVFESATLIAMFVYLVAAVLIIAVLMAIASFPTPGGRTAVMRSSHRERAGHDH